MRMHSKKILCLLIAAFYAFFLVLMAHDLWTVFHRQGEWKYVFGMEGFGWAYKARANYITSGIALLLWNLLGLALALLATWNRRFRSYPDLYVFRLEVGLATVAHAAQDAFCPDFLPTFRHGENTMRFCILLLCVLGGLVPCRDAQAAPFSAVIDGMSITVSEPWALYTRVYPQSPESFTLTYAKVDEGGSDIVGEVYADLYSLRPEARPPAHEALKSMTAGELQSLVRSLGKGYLHFPEPHGSLELVRQKEHSVIICKEFQEGNERAPKPCHSFISYHLLGDHLAVLFAYIYGSEDEARLLEAMCGSFDPSSAGNEKLLARNSVAWGGISFNAPPQLAYLGRA